MREFRYRFGQAVVFGAPVIALQVFGRSLGGAESDRWVTVFQALLAGGVVFVAATGMLVDGAMLLVSGRKPSRAAWCDLAVASAAFILYLSGLPRLVGLVAGYESVRNWPAPFAACVSLLAVWTGLRWMAQKNRPGPG